MKTIMKSSVFVVCVSTVFAGCLTRESNEGATGESLTVQNDIATPYTFKSPNGIIEKCTILPKMPGADYDKGDEKDELKYCKVDFYASNIGLCPKTKSTSPGTYVYSLIKPGMTPSSFESGGFCKDTDNIPSDVANKLASFKQTMNEAKTSGTFSTSSLLYYHFSRYFDTSVSVPVSVYREMDRKIHLKRISELGAKMTTKGMIDAGWDVMKSAEANPDSYPATFELFTKDKSKIYGVLLRAKGERYGVEVNGIRSSWGVGDSQDFQRTPAFEALKNTNAITNAVTNTKANYGKVIAELKVKANSSRDAELDALGARIKNMPSEQIAYWMAEVADIALLDTIFSQQDRIGNIDFEWEWTYKVNDPEKGLTVKHQDVDSKFKKATVAKYDQIFASMPAELKQYSPKLLQRSVIGDNDAGGRFEYTSFAKKTNMLANLRHFNGKTYSRLLKLNQDLQAKGPIWQYINKNFPLSEQKQIPQIVTNVKFAADALKFSCDKGLLKLDLNPEEFFLNLKVVEKYKCDGSLK